MAMLGQSAPHDQAKAGIVAYSATQQVCRSCHGSGPWYGTPNIQTKSHNSSKDCTASGCHTESTALNYTQFHKGAAFIRPLLRSAIIGGGRPHLVPGGGVDAAATADVNSAQFNHQGVLPGECATCHNGQAAKGLPAKHLKSQSSCDSCHRTTAWKPADFSHQGVPFGQCQICHNGLNGPGKVANHFVTSRSCDACHQVVAWLPVKYNHTSPLYQAQPDKTTCQSCHITNGEIIPRQMRNGKTTKPLP
jgi:hypothetical protein